MNQMATSLKIPLLSLLSSYNDLNKKGLLITAYDDKNIGYMVVGLEKPINNIREYLKQNKKQINHIADLLNIRVNSLLWYYCKAAGIIDKEAYWKISDEFIH